jgi:predicted alpha/beta superfamily hydrolase
MYRNILLLVFLFGINALPAQVISGLVVDSANGEKLPYVNIGIRKKNVGTTSRENGTFSISVPPANGKDTLTFSMTGYSERRIAVADLRAAENIVALAAKPFMMTAVPITDKKVHEIKRGIKSRSLIFGIMGEANDPDDILEIAQLIHLDTALSKITSLNLYINESVYDTATFRLNFYDYEDGFPGERLIESNLLFTVPVKPGWLRFDLAQFNIFLRGDIVASVEFIPTTQRKNTNNIFYGVKFGGLSHSFVRTSSFGEWSVPPHHYPVFVTTLGTEASSLKDETEEKESAPEFRIFSNAVNDSFYIFVRLPADYSSGNTKSYPVVFLLDANVYFDILATPAEEQDAFRGSILIGVGYRDVYCMDSLRNRDYTFPIAVATDSFQVSGGGNAFYTFLEEELVPFVDSAYRTDKKSRTLMGHSLGGYFTLFALEKDIAARNTVFCKYVAASPSLDYGDQYLIRKFSEAAGNDTISRQLFLTIGETEIKEGDGTLFNKLTDQLKEKRFGNVQLRRVIYPGLDHMSTVIPTFTGKPGTKRKGRK